jgi:hypothetical protein
LELNEEVEEEVLDDSSLGSWSANVGRDDVLDNSSMGPWPIFIDGGM